MIIIHVACTPGMWTHVVYPVWVVPIYIKLHMYLVEGTINLSPACTHTNDTLLYLCTGCWLFNTLKRCITHVQQGLSEDCHVSAQSLPWHS